MHALVHPWVFLKAVYGTFFVENVSFHAAGLAFKTLLSLIPLGVAVATVFLVVEFDVPAGESEAGKTATSTEAAPAGAAADDELTGLRKLIERFFLPDQAQKATAWVEDQVRRLQKSSTPVTVISLLLLCGTAFFLFRTVEQVMNLVYRVHTPRSYGAQLLAFWAFLTLGPLLVAASIYASHTFSLPLGGWEDRLAEVKEWGTQALPFTITWIGFFLLNWLAPNAHVKKLCALTGAFVAALLWEAMKHGFNYFLASFASYEPLYGGLATGVILLVWLYLSWYVAILGATLAYHLQYRPGRVPLAEPDARLRTAMSLLLAVAAKHRSGEDRLTLRQLAKRLRCPEGLLHATGQRLVAHGILAEADARSPGYLLARAPETVPLAEVYQALGGSGDASGSPDPRVDGLFRDVESGVAAALGDRTLADLVGRRTLENPVTRQ